MVCEAVRRGVSHRPWVRAVLWPHLDCRSGVEHHRGPLARHLCLLLTESVVKTNSTRSHEGVKVSSTRHSQPNGLTCSYFGPPIRKWFTLSQIWRSSSV